MGTWYTIGLCLGVGVAIGVAVSGILGSTTIGAGLAVLAGATAGAIVGLVIGDAAETSAGAVGGALGALSATVVVRGAIRRGATRLGVAAYLGAVGVLVLLVSLVPVAGYLVVVALPLLALRMRGRQAARFAGLRTLAR